MGNYVLSIFTGQFIDTYRGEIITDKEATRREQTGGSLKASYLYSLDKHAESEGFTKEESKCTLRNISLPTELC